MFQEFEEVFLPGDGVQIFARIGGPADAPPLLLLHGYPQTSAMWHLVAPQLARDFRVICPDLRGYGRSDKPASDALHQTYSKRAMAADIAAVMTRLGHARFHVAAHDRGARVAHRLGLDHAARVLDMTLLDIAPTREMYAHAGTGFATAYWHWYFLIQPSPIPETMIGHDPDGYWRAKCLDQDGSGPFAPEALAEYLAAFADVAAIHASCEDYRAAASIDIRHDDEDAGARLEMPVQVLWGAKGIIGRYFDPVALWRERAAQVTAEEVPAGHYMAEEIPDLITARIRAHASGQTAPANS